MKASEELLAMRELLAGPGAWIQGWYAKDKRGRNVPSYKPSAVCFCMAGAVNRLNMSEEAHMHLSRELGDRGFLSLEAFNDETGRTHLEVVEMIERAAVAAMKEEAND